MDKSQKLGSKTAKSGFENEKDIRDRFNRYQENDEVKTWLKTMGYTIGDITYLNAEILGGRKADIQLKIHTRDSKIEYVENIQAKLVSGKAGYNHVDKRWVEQYKNRWDIPDDIILLLKYYTGEIAPYRSGTIDSRKMNMNEFTEEERGKMVEWFSDNRQLIFKSIFQGEEPASVNWFLITQKLGREKRTTLIPIAEILNMLEGEVTVTKNGILSIGSNLKMQRKGGDRGRPSANMLQFKCNPIYFTRKYLER